MLGCQGYQTKNRSTDVYEVAPGTCERIRSTLLADGVKNHEEIRLLGEKIKKISIIMHQFGCCSILVCKVYVDPAQVKGYKISCI